MTCQSYRRLVVSFISALLLGAICGCGGDDESDSGDSSASDTGPRQRAASVPEPPALPEFPTGMCRVYTSQPGFHVAVDGNLVRDARGELVQTPCAVRSAEGSHEVTVFKKGAADRSRIVLFAADAEVVFEIDPNAVGAQSRLLAMPYSGAAVGEPLALDAVNSPSAEFDPFLSPDGSLLYFAADRSEGRGIYIASRTSALDEFGPPQLIQLTRSSDMRGSPSLTRDLLNVVYTVPEKATIWSITRPDVFSERFTGKKALRSAEQRGRLWASAQILGDGLRLYWLEETGGKFQTYVSTRDAMDQPFKTMRTIALPGGHPCLSADGLRQYAFDGKVLKRARRASLEARFARAETIAKLNLPNFKLSRRHRQFFVTSDEQWMVYCDDPAAGGDLYLVRLSDAPQWGVAATGEPIEPRVVAAADSPDSDKPDSDKSDSTEPAGDGPPKEAPKPVDPRSLPLPYSVFRAKFTDLLANRKYDEAETLLEKAAADPELADDAESIKWDAADFALVRAFWKHVEEAVARLKPDDEVRIGGIRLAFVKRDGKAIVVRSKSSEVRREVSQLESADLAALHDRFIDAGDEEGQLRSAVFLYYDSGELRSSVETRLERAGDGGSQFVERLGERTLRLAKRELERENLAQGVDLVDTVLKTAKKTEVAKRAAALKDELYSYVKWRPVGKRKWVMKNNAYAAAYDRFPESLLVSPRKYENFELSLEWKTEGVTGQGGVFFHYSGERYPYDNAFKIQFASDYRVADDQFSTGALFGVEAPKVNAVKPTGEWNTFLMRVRGEKVSVTINGRKVLDTTASDPDIGKKGYVALDGMVGGITYRKVLLSELRD
jgi:hypothetical protein